VYKRAATTKRGEWEKRKGRERERERERKKEAAREKKGNCRLSRFSIS
jgi:hypothetical protein